MTRVALAVVAMVAAVTAGSPLGGVHGALAHDEGAQVVRRELVRLQGTRSDSAVTPGAQGESVTEITALGKRSVFRASDRRVFTVGGGNLTATPAPSPDDPSASLRSVSLQGERADLSRFNAARPDQRVTILAERRVGSSELFLLALDLCPER